jgi:peptide/nickel transport system substrate-binding protein
MFNKKMGLLVAMIMVFAVLLVACQPETVEVVKEVPVEVTRVVTETITEAGESMEVTRVVTEQVVVTATPEPAAPVSFEPSDPTTYIDMSFGEPDTLDPALDYETSGGEILLNVYETLVFYNGTDPTSYVPVLAEEVPSVENGLIADTEDGGQSYTFNIRDGITFHAGGTLEPHDVAYSFQRGLLQSSPDGPQWLLLEPIMNYGDCADITQGIDPECGLAGDPDAVKAADPAALLAICEEVQSRIVADDEAGTVTFNLALPWGPFLATIAQPWGGVLDMEWAIEQGSWDGDCATWQNWYGTVSENSELTAITNGTGPYQLDHWTPGEEWVLTANPNYWRTDDMPVWEGGPAGQPRLQTIIYKVVDEWGTRFAALQAGDADRVTVNLENRPQADQFVGEFCDAEGNCRPNEENPDGPLRKWENLPSTSRTDIFMTFNIAEDSPYIGSGQLDGNGIPNDFFNDIHVRKAMNYCFDYDTYIADALNGEGVRNNGPIIKDMLGYNEDGEYYPFDMALCEEELAQAWDGALPETGFRFSAAFNTGNTTRQTIGEILQANLASINPLYQVDVVGMPWPTFLRSFRAAQVPVIASGWVEDIHDPHNWVQPFTVGTYAGRQNLPADLKAQFQELVNAGVAAADPAVREQIYFDLQKLHHDQAIQVTLAQAAGARYEQRWVQDYFFNVALFGQYFYAYGK